MRQTEYNHETFEEIAVFEKGFKVNDECYLDASGNLFVKNLDVATLNVTNFSAKGVFPIGSVVPIAAHLIGSMSIPAIGLVNNEGWMQCSGAAIPAGNAITGNTPNINSDRFLRGSTAAGATGGANTHSHSMNNMLSTLTLVHSHTMAHTHTIPTHAHSMASHTHASVSHSHLIASNHIHNFNHTHTLSNVYAKYGVSIVNNYAYHSFNTLGLTAADRDGFTYNRRMGVGGRAALQTPNYPGVNVALLGGSLSSTAETLPPSSTGTGSNSQTSTTNSAATTSVAVATNSGAVSPAAATLPNALTDYAATHGHANTTDNHLPSYINLLYMIRVK